jgi:Dolichyl-phosphate-mannose-protein mannosyltransferase
MDSPAIDPSGAGPAAAEKTEKDPSTTFWLLGFLGLALRLVPYLVNRSLWNDEAFVALNLLHRPLSALSGRLEFDQAAPLGFLWLSKLAEMVFGPGERALRLEPLLAALAAMVLFFWVARRLLRRPAAIVACAIFVLSPTLIYYASELKQYSGDVLAALLLCSAAIRWQEKPAVRSYLLLAAAGVAAIFLSHPAAFVAAGVGIACVLGTARERRGAHIAGLAAVGMVWTSAFVALYLVSLRRLESDAFYRAYFLDARGFVPWSPEKFASWGVNALLSLFNQTAGISLGGVALLCAVLGLFVWRRSPVRLVSWVGPVVLAFLAACLRLYPFVARTMLFAVPAAALLVGEGADTMRHRVGAVGRAPYFVLLGVLFAQPALIAARTLVRPRGREELRPVLEQIRREQQAGDTYYFYYGGQFAARYYLETRGLPFSGPLAQAALAPIAAMKRGAEWYPPALRSVPPDLFVGENHRKDWAAYGRELEELRGRKRAWIVFAHVFNWGPVDERALFLQDLDHLGKRLGAIEQDGASAYLYDFGGIPR